MLVCSSHLEASEGITAASSVVFLGRCSPGAGVSSGQVHEDGGGHHLLLRLCNHGQRHPSLLQEGGHHLCVSGFFSTGIHRCGDDLELPERFLLVPEGHVGASDLDLCPVLLQARLDPSAWLAAPVVEALV